MARSAKHYAKGNYYKKSTAREDAPRERSYYEARPRQERVREAEAPRERIKEAKPRAAKPQKIRTETSKGVKTLCLVFRIIISVAAVAGMIFFFLPILMNYFTIASVFGVAVCAFALLLVNLRGLVTGHGKRKALTGLYNVVTVLFVIFVGWLAFVSFQMFTVDNGVPESDATVVVLGARVYEQGVSMSLKNRLDSSYEFLTDNPEAKCVVTGGQGSNEPWSEASAEKAYLVSMGIDESRIFMEERSTSTRENLLYARDVIEENGLNPSIVIVTHDFHQFRARSMAKDLGYKSYGYECDSELLLFPTYYARELMAVTKYYIDKVI